MLAGATESRFSARSLDRLPRERHRPRARRPYAACLRTAAGPGGGTSDARAALHHHHRFDAVPEGPSAEMETSRGGPCRCASCAGTARATRLRKRPLATVLEELDAPSPRACATSISSTSASCPTRPCSRSSGRGTWCSASSSGSTAGRARCSISSAALAASRSRPASSALVDRGDGRARQAVQRVDRGAHRAARPRPAQRALRAGQPERRRASAIRPRRRRGGSASSGSACGPTSLSRRSRTLARPRTPGDGGAGRRRLGSGRTPIISPSTGRSAICQTAGRCRSLELECMARVDRGSPGAGGAAPGRVLMTADTQGGVWTVALELAGALSRAGVATVLGDQWAGPLSPAARAAAAAVPGLELVESAYRLEWMDDPWDDVAAAGDWLLDLEERGAAGPRPPERLLPRGPAVPGAPRRRGALLRAVVVARGAPPAGAGRATSATARGSPRGSGPRTRWSRRARAMLSALAGEYGALGLGRGQCHPSTRATAGAFAPAPKEPFVFAAGRLWDEAKNLAALEKVASPTSRGLCSWPGATSRRAASAAAPGRASAPSVWVDEPELTWWMSRAAIYASRRGTRRSAWPPWRPPSPASALVLGDLPSLREVWRDAALSRPRGRSARAPAALDHLIWTSAPRGARRARSAGARCAQRCAPWPAATSTSHALALRRPPAGSPAGSGLSSSSPSPCGTPCGMKPSSATPCSPTGIHADAHFSAGSRPSSTRAATTCLAFEPRGRLSALGLRRRVRPGQRCARPPPSIRAPPAPLRALHADLDAALRGLTSCSSTSGASPSCVRRSASTARARRSLSPLLPRHAPRGHHRSGRDRAALDLFGGTTACSAFERAFAIST